MPCVNFTSDIIFCNILVIVLYFYGAIMRIPLIFSIFLLCFSVTSRAGDLVQCSYAVACPVGESWKHCRMVGDRAAIFKIGRPHFYNADLFTLVHVYSDAGRAYCFYSNRYARFEFESRSRYFLRPSRLKSYRGAWRHGNCNPSRHTCLLEIVR